jgi:hypothetical protein
MEKKRRRGRDERRGEERKRIGEVVTSELVVVRVARRAICVMSGS